MNKEVVRKEGISAGISLRESFAVEQSKTRSISNGGKIL
jgi:hypothetical protein